MVPSVWTQEVPRVRANLKAVDRAYLVATLAFVGVRGYRPSSCEAPAGRQEQASLGKPPLRVGYLTNRYGAASYTFIMTEVEHLRNRGHTIRTYSVRHPGTGEAVSAQVRREQQGTNYLLAPGRPLTSVALIVWASVKALARHPRRFATTLALAWRSSPQGLRGRLRQLAYLVFACRLSELLRADGIQHLHNHLGSASATIAMLASSLTGIPFSLTIHGGHIFYEPHYWALGEKIRRSTFAACVSDFCRSQCMVFVTHETWPKLRVVRCSVDDRFLDAPLSPPAHGAGLVCVARLAEEKGHIVLLQAVKKVRVAGQDVRLVLVGDGPLRRTLDEGIRELELEGIVEITGLVDAEEVRRRVMAARAFVLASLTEGLPVSIMEALALGRPVIAPNVGAIAELVRNGETGWLVSPGNSDLLAEAMMAALRAPDEVLAAMGRRGAALVGERHRAAHEIPKLEDLLASSAAAQQGPLSNPKQGC